MANLYVTFMDAFPTTLGRRATSPIPRGSGAQTEVIEIPTGTPTTGVLRATGNQPAVRIKAAAACWVSIGQSPNPTSVNGIRAAHYFAEGDTEDFFVSSEDRIAVVGV